LLIGTSKTIRLQKYQGTFYQGNLLFSPHHEEVFDVRTNEGNYNFELRVLYSQDYDMTKWLEVPYKEHFKNDVYVYDKPMLMIANRYNMEWGGAPISFYSIEDLDFMISHLKRLYHSL
jgi:hypothetical protein